MVAKEQVRSARPAVLPIRLNSLPVSVTLATLAPKPRGLRISASSTLALIAGKAISLATRILNTAPVRCRAGLSSGRKSLTDGRHTASAVPLDKRNTRNEVTPSHAQVTGGVKT